MANPSFEKGAEDHSYIDKAIEREMKNSKYDSKEFMQLVSDELMSGKGYTLIKGEMFGKVDASGEKVTKDKIDIYLEGLGGDDFGRDIFDKAKKNIVKEYQSNPEEYWKRYAEDYDRRSFVDKKTGKNALTPEEQKNSDAVAQVLFNKEKIALRDISLKDAIDNHLFPKFEIKNIVLRALTIWETQDRTVRLKALKKNAATSGAVRRRVTLQEQVKGYDKTVHKAEYALGSAEMAAEFAKTAATLNKTLKYRAIGGVSIATWDAEKARTESEWRTRWQRLAIQFSDLYVSGRLYNEFPTAVTESDKVFGVIDALVRLNAKGGMKEANATFDAENFKRDLDKRFGKDMIYGSYGVFNMLLALERSNKEVQLNGGGSKVLYDLQVGKGRAPKHRFSRLDTRALQDGEVKDAKPDDKQGAGEEKPIEKAEAPKDILDQFSDEMSQVLTDLEKSTGVKMTKKAGRDKFANTKFIDIHGEYKGANKKFLRIVLINGKITLPQRKGEFLNPKEAVTETKIELAKRAESFKKEIDARESEAIKEREAALQAAKEANKEKWYKDFDAFLDANKNDFILERIKVGKEFQSKYTLEAPKRITITYDYKVTVNGRDVYLVPVIEEGRVRLWARIVNKAGTTMKDRTMAVDFKNPRKFASDLKAIEKEFQDMEDPQQELPPIEKGGQMPKAQDKTPAQAPAAGLPESATKVAAPAQAPVKAAAPAKTPTVAPNIPAKAPETAKSLSDGMSTERPKDIATAAKQLKEIYDKLDPKIVWGAVMTTSEPSFMLTINNINQTITARLDDSITKPGEKEIQFVIHNKKTETFRNNQKELAQYIEGLLAKK